MTCKEVLSHPDTVALDSFRYALAGQVYGFSEADKQQAVKELDAEKAGLEEAINRVQEFVKGGKKTRTIRERLRGKS